MESSNAMCLSDERLHIQHASAEGTAVTGGYTLAGSAKVLQVL